MGAYVTSGHQTFACDSDAKLFRGSINSSSQTAHHHIFEANFFLLILHAWLHNQLLRLAEFSTLAVPKDNAKLLNTRTTVLTVFLVKMAIFIAFVRSASFHRLRTYSEPQHEGRRS